MSDHSVRILGAHVPGSDVLLTPTGDNVEVRAFNSTGVSVTIPLSQLQLAVEHLATLAAARDSAFTTALAGKDTTNG